MTARLLLSCVCLSVGSLLAQAQQTDGGGGYRMALSYDVNAAAAAAKPAVTMALASMAAPATAVAAASRVVKPWVRLNARTASDGSVRLKWQTNPKQKNRVFLVERSADGVLWDQLAQVNGTDTTAHRDSYQYIDRQAQPGTKYRLFCLVGDSTRMYTSTIALLDPNRSNQGLRYYAVQQNSITVGIDVDRVRFPVTINVYCEDGGLICNDVLLKPSGEFLVELPDTKDKEKAVRLQVVDGTGRVLTVRRVPLPTN